MNRECAIRHIVDAIETSKRNVAEFTKRGDQARMDSELDLLARLEKARDKYTQKR